MKIKTKLLSLLLAFAAFVATNCDDSVAATGSCTYPEDIGDDVGKVCQENLDPTDCEEDGMDFSEAVCADIGFPKDCGDDLWIAAETDCSEVH